MDKVYIVWAGVSEEDMIIDDIYEDYDDAQTRRHNLINNTKQVCFIQRFPVIKKGEFDERA